MRCFILCKDGICRINEISSKKTWFKFQGSMYQVDSKAKGTSKDGETEFLYIENNPIPFKSTEDSIKFLTALGIKGKLLGLKGKSLSPWNEALLGYFKSPEKIFTLAIGLFLAGILLLTFMGMTPF